MTEPMVVVGIDKLVPRRADIGGEPVIDFFGQCQIVFTASRLVGIEYHLQLFALTPTAIDERLAVRAFRFHGTLDVCIHHFLAHGCREGGFGFHFHKAPLLLGIVCLFSQFGNSAIGGSGDGEIELLCVVFYFVDTRLCVNSFE